MVFPKYILLSLLVTLTIAAPYPSDEAVNSVEITGVADITGTSFDTEQQRPKPGVCALFKQIEAA